MNPLIRIWFFYAMVCMCLSACHKQPNWNDRDWGVCQRNCDAQPAPNNYDPNNQK